MEERGFSRTKAIGKAIAEKLGSESVMMRIIRVRIAMVGIVLLLCAPLMVRAVPIGFVTYGFDPSIVIDSCNQIHLSFYGSNLDYGIWDGISWSFEDVDLDSTSPRGQDSSIFLDIQETPHISYPGRISHISSYQMMYATREQDVWTPVEIDVVGGGIGQTSLGINDEGESWVSWTGPKDVGARYSHFDGISWATGSIETSAPPTASNTLAIDPVTGNPMVAYSTKAGEADYELRVAEWNGASWDTETIESGLSRGNIQSSIQIDDAGNAHVLYIDQDANLKYASRENDIWSIETIDVEVLEYSPVSLRLDSEGNAHIAYMKGEQDQVPPFAADFSLVYAFLDIDAGWEFTPIVEHSETLEPIQGLALAVDNDLNAHMVFVDTGDSGRGLYHTTIPEPGTLLLLGLGGLMVRKRGQA